MKFIKFSVAYAAMILAASAQSSFAQESTSKMYAGPLVGLQSSKGKVYEDYSDSLWAETEDNLATFGGLVGWRQDNGDWNYGVELDLSAALNGSLDGGGPCGSPGCGEWKNYLGNAHARFLLGKDLGDLTIFGAAGVAAARIEYTNEIAGTETENMVGYTIGVGAEYKATDAVSFRLEALHDQFGDATMSDGYNAKWSQNEVRAAAIFEF